MTFKELEQAFPSDVDLDKYEKGYSHIGMTLRDYFAAKAMQGFMTNITKNTETSVQLYAKTAYQIADAMLKERENV